MTALWVLVVAAESTLLFLGERRIFPAILTLTRMRLVAYFLAAPGTVLHESAHYLAALLLHVPAGSRVLGADGKRAHVTFFRPRQDANGSITLGSVPVAASDPLRSSLIAIAPLLLVPPLFALFTLWLLNPHGLTGIWQAFAGAPWWKAAIWAYVGLSCGQAAFPSRGDRVGPLGVLALLLAAGLAVSLLVSAGELNSALSGLALLFAFPALAASLSLAMLSAFSVSKR